MREHRRGLLAALPVSSRKRPTRFMCRASLVASAERVPGGERVWAVRWERNRLKGPERLHLQSSRRPEHTKR